MVDHSHCQDSLSQRTHLPVVTIASWMMMSALVILAVGYFLLCWEVVTFWLSPDFEDLLNNDWWRRSANEQIIRNLPMTGE